MTNDSRQNEPKHGGWYGDPTGHARAANIRWHPNDAGHSGHGGWYGDAKGHSQAARRGWEGRCG